jgi:hypothetical protein
VTSCLARRNKTPRLFENSGSESSSGRAFSCPKDLSKVWGAEELSRDERVNALASSSMYLSLTRPR